MSVRFCMPCRRNKNFSVFFRYLNIPLVFLLCVFSIVIAQSDDIAPTVETETPPPEVQTAPSETPILPQDNSVHTTNEIPATTVSSPESPEPQNISSSESAPVSSIEVELVPTVTPETATPDSSTTGSLETTSTTPPSGGVEGNNNQASSEVPPQSVSTDTPAEPPISSE